MPLDFRLIRGLGDPKHSSRVAGQKFRAVVSDLLKRVRRPHSNQGVRDGQPADQGGEEAGSTQDPPYGKRTSAE